MRRYLPDLIDLVLERKIDPGKVFDLTLPLDQVAEGYFAGCADWRDHGLAPPTAVTAATAVYLQAQDAITAWIDECCEQGPAAWAPSATLFNSWTAWTETAGEYAGSRTRFLDALESRGFEPFRKAKARGVQGLSIRVSDAKDPDWVVRE